MTELPDALERLASRGEPRGADQVLADARYALADGVLLRTAQPDRVTWRRPVVALVAAFLTVSVIGVVGVALSSHERQLSPRSASEAISEPNLGADGDFFMLDDAEWRLIDSWKAGGPQATFALYQRDGASLTISTGSVATEQLENLKGGVATEGGVRVFEFEDGIAFSWRTNDDLTVVVICTGLDEAESIELAARVVPVDGETWNSARPLGGENAPATTMPVSP